MILEIRHLQLLDAIGAEGTVSKAAQRLHLTQPAVSHALRSLERRLGVELFRRERRRMVPTVEGERLLRSAQVVLTEVQRAEHDVSQLKSGYHGVLRITTQCYTCYHWLPGILRSFNQTFPKIDIQIVPEATNKPFESLRDRTVDLAIVHHEPEGSDIALRKLFRDELVAVVPPGHRFASRRSLAAEDFAEEQVILHSAPYQSTFYEEMLKPAGVEPPRILALQLSEAVLESVKAGLGVSIMARWTVEPEMKRGAVRTVRLATRGLWRIWYAAVLAYRADSPALVSLIDLLKKNALSAVESCAASA